MLLLGGARSGTVRQVADQSTQPVVDVVLGALVKAVNRGETSNLGISLVVGGTWLTGSMIGGRMWFDQLGQLVERETSNEAGQLFRLIGRVAYPSESEGLAEGSIHRPPCGSS